MNALRTQPEFPAPALENAHPSSGLWPTGARNHDEAGETIPAVAPASNFAATCAIETVRAPLPTATTRPVGPCPITAGGVYDVVIPQAPRMPFSLRPRTSQRNRFRAEVLVEWVKLNAADPRCE